MNIKTESLSVEKTLAFFKSIISSKTIEECLQIPVHILTYNHFLSLEQSELEKPFKHGSVYQSCLHIRNPLFLSAFLERRVQWEEQPEEIKWIFKHIPQPSIELYNTIYSLYRSLLDEAHDFLEPKKSDKLPYHITMFLDFLLFKEKSEEKNILFNAFCEDYLLKYKDGIIKDYIFYNGPDNKDILIEVFKKKEINFNQIYNISDFLLNSIKNSYSKDFWVSSTDVKKIDKLFQLGFVIDKDLIINDEHILNCIIESKRTDIFDLFLPHINCLAPLTSESVALLEKNSYFKEKFQFMENFQTKEQLKKHLDKSLKTLSKQKLPKI